MIHLPTFIPFSFLIVIVSIDYFISSMVSGLSPESLSCKSSALTTRPSLLIKRLGNNYFCSKEENKQMIRKNLSCSKGEKIT